MNNELIKAAKVIYHVIDACDDISSTHMVLEGHHISCDVGYVWEFLEEVINIEEE